VDAHHKDDDGQHVSSTKKMFGLMTPWGFGRARKYEREDERTLGQHLADRGGDGDYGLHAENARTFSNRAAHTRRGPRSRTFALAPTAAAQFAVGASALIERWAPKSQLARPGVCALSLSGCALSLSKGTIPKGATASGRKAPRNSRSVMTRASPFLPHDSRPEPGCRQSAPTELVTPTPNGPGRSNR
jgi:hypothetical protein